MADFPELKLDLGETLGARLLAAARAAGQPIEAYATELIADALDEDWAEAYARYAEYQRTGEYLDAEEVLERFQRNLAEALRAKRA